MAYFYWVGGATGTTGSYTDGLEGTTAYTGEYNLTWVRAFDWNNPLNWRVPISSNSTSFKTPNRCPSGLENDIVYVGIYAGPTAADSNELWGVPKAKAPLLFGGCTLAGPTATWLGGATSGANHSGTTFAAFLTRFIINNDALARNVGTSAYDFSFIGGGFEGSTYRNGSLDNAVNCGFTLDSSIWGGAPIVDLSAAFIGSTFYGERHKQLRMKCVDITTAYNNENTVNAGEKSPGSTSSTVNNQGVVSIVALPTYASVGSGTTAMTYVSNKASLYGSPHYILSGKFNEIKRAGVRRGATGCLQITESIGRGVGRPRPHLSLIGVTAGLIKQDDYYMNYCGSWYFDQNCQLGKLYMMVLNEDFLVELDGSGFQREKVLAELGLSGATGTSIINENIDISCLQSPPGFANSTYNTREWYGARKHGVYIGGVDSSLARGVTANLIKIHNTTSDNDGQYPTVRGLTFAINGNLVANEVLVSQVKIIADSTQPLNRYVNIDLLRLGQGADSGYFGAKLDFSCQPEFNNWNFGKQVGTEIQGGIVSQMEDGSVIEGSPGLRLWNEQVISEFRIGGAARSGAKVSSQPTVLPEEYI